MSLWGRSSGHLDLANAVQGRFYRRSSALGLLVQLCGDGAPLSGR